MQTLNAGQAEHNEIKRNEMKTEENNMKKKTTHVNGITKLRAYNANTRCILRCTHHYHFKCHSDERRLFSLLFSARK